MKKVIYLISFIGILIDQITKILISNFIVDVPIIPHFFSLTYVRNTGGAWGILNDNLWLLIIISVVALFVINKVIFEEKKLNKRLALSYGFLIGGIFGNLLDRLFRGYVVDFLNFQFPWYDFPVFNIADCLIVFGVIIMFIEVIWSTKKAK